MARISDVSDVVESVLPSLAFIRTPDGMGSGWAYQDDLFVSNQHVVGDATEVELRCGGKMRKGKVLGTDSAADLSVIKWESTAPSLTINYEVKLGQTCIALGSPRGFQNSVSVGVVSGLGRAITMGDHVHEQVMQIDAAINPGNSGGPLVNLDGELIGVNFAKMTNDDGINWAIPAEIVSFVVPRLIEHGKVKRAKIGLRLVEELDQEGNLVVHAEKVFAAQSPVKEGDRILKVGANMVTRRLDVWYAVAESWEKDGIDLVVQRGEEVIELVVPTSSDE